MSIGVESYPELYTLLLGWELYDKLWNLLSETGIAYLPFLGLILRNVSESYATHHASGQLSLRSMQISLISMLLLIVFAVSPCIPVSARAISYTPVCKSDQYFPGDTGTTYDKAFTVPSENIYVPMWWYAVISISEGMTHAANTFVSCTPNPRKMVTEVDMAQISDTEVKQELRDFETMCYIPARIAFNQDKKNNNESSLDRIEENAKEYGVEDTEWKGSHGFTEVYYPHLNAMRPVPGFAWDASQDINADQEKDAPPAYGTPTCAEWWTDSENGLKARIYQALPKSFYDEFRDFLDSAKTRDDIVKRIISLPSGGVPNANKTIGDYGYSHLAEALGVWMHTLTEYPKLYAASQAAPILQALLLMLIYAFMPFALVFSSYRASAFVTGSIVIFSVIFWGFIWHLVSWTDTVLMQALYSNWFERQGAGATLADMIIASLVIFAPLFWFVFMGVMGVRIGDVVGMVSAGVHGIGGSAAGKTSKLAKNAARIIMG